MNDLPSGWEWVTTRELFTFVTSGSRGWARYYSDEGAPFIRVGDLPRGSIRPDLSDIQRVKPPSGSEGLRTKVRENDILISITADLGRVALMSDVKEDSYISQHVALARPINRINPRYLSWYLSSNSVQHQWLTQQRGATKLGLGLEDIRSISVPLPPVNEQARIVGAIEEQFSRLDAGVDALHEARKKISRMHHAVLESAVQGSLTGSGQTTWPLTTVDHIAEVSGGITKNPKRAPKDNTAPFLRVANVLRGKLDLHDVHQIELFPNDLERYGLRCGDLLVVEGNGSLDQIGRSALWDDSIDPCVHQNHLIRIRPGSKIIPEYLNIFWNSPSGTKQIRSLASSTSGLHTLSTGKVRRINLLLPPLDEQRRAVAEVSRQTAAIEHANNQLDTAEAHSRALRSSILSAAFSGKLT